MIAWRLVRLFFGYDFIQIGKCSMHAFSIQSPVNLQAKPNKLVKPELSAGPSRDVRALTKGGHILVFRFDLLIPKSAEDLFSLAILVFY